jgi:REP element-mobilizing transposase RayT
MQLIPLAAQPRLWNYLAGIALNHRMQPLAIGGTENHVHLLLTVPADLALADAVRVLKANSSRLMRQNSRSFSWQEGYGAFSVSPPQVEGVMRYIANQAAHHHGQTYEEEFAGIVNTAKIPVAPKGARNR